MNQVYWGGVAPTVLHCHRQRDCAQIMDRVQLLPDATGEGQSWNRAPLHKQLLLAAVFLAAFLLLDGASTASQAWEGAPACYLPVGLTLAVLLCGGLRYVAPDIHFQPGRGGGELSSAALFLGRDSGFDNDLLRLYSRCGNSPRTMAHRSQARHPARCGQVCADFSRRGHRQRSSRHADSARRRYRSSLRRPKNNSGLAGQ